METKCERCKKRKATAIIRTFDVCGRCFYTLRVDNLHRVKLDVDIPQSFDLI